MWLSIDPEKVKEQIAKSPAYVVTSASNFEPPTVPYDPVSAEIHSTTSAIPADMERARARLLALRQSIIKPPASDDLDREIDEIRGR
jgi:hypothetical protein